MILIKILAIVLFSPFFFLLSDDAAYQLAAILLIISGLDRLAAWFDKSTSLASAKS